MGMAASQARYLELTARKTNVEYQGQQINQQRTALANESAGLFSQLMGLTVPTAPSSTSYTSTVYSFTQGNTDYTITDISDKAESAENNATVTYTYDDTEYEGAYSQRSDLAITSKVTTTTTSGTTSTTTTWYYGTTKMTAYAEDTDKTAVAQIAEDCSSTAVAKDYDATNTDQIYSYTKGGTTYYVSLDEKDSSVITSCYAADTTSKVSTTSEAYLTTEDSGRYSSIQLDGYSTSYDLTATSTTNETAYNDAMNEYEYQTQLYQQQVNNLNAKTEIIEQEDKTLEVQLKQLDTEQEALSTELESVKKVIDKNIEQTFKTFSS
jgi:hypothetical protein